MPTTARNFKNTVYGHLARVGKALSTGSRLELLDLLAQAPKTVAELAEGASLSVPNTSQHLRTLREVGLVTSERDGNHVIYRLAGPDVADFVSSMQQLATRRLADLEAAERSFFADSGEEVSADKLREWMRGGAVELVDVRPREEFDAGHIDGAVSVPIDELEGRVEELPRDRNIVVYCRGPYCTYAARGVELLQQKGFEALRLREGYPDWRARGYANEDQGKEHR
ncbi:metalloregulator ArsR/SmtB family transcription factor [Persicimonas caeni]|uniref:Metalloregulator ArsR/SmtB family transcription factor n=1 Tax=Persicimonas caeni TaxID=2292766 RepID=A0A4Y6PYE0_PERCE|nr:metalloregulator ArsR/SmtB family transcription factor [Persicimonas caeni]QDG53027.1 metalloregulator ArsR/SmtB family transcription factor [Persicimonas caeni]QED34249.1 metalloregulator ArsR/SmtB family transcription factor [Persicimonas caeni]